MLQEVQLRNVKNNIQQHLPGQCPEQWLAMLSDGHCSAGYGTERADVELKKSS